LEQLDSLHSRGLAENDGGSKSNKINVILDLRQQYRESRKSVRRGCIQCTMRQEVEWRVQAQKLPGILAKCRIMHCCNRDITAIKQQVEAPRRPGICAENMTVSRPFRHILLTQM